jgi:DNA-binding transcriptional regulator GbsR (MarR family)
MVDDVGIGKHETDDPGGDEKDEVLLQAVERFAMLMTEAGMPRMPARVFAYLIIDETDRGTAGELAAALQVSPAAISGAVRYLIQAGLLVRERSPGARSDHYRLHNDLWYEVQLQRTDILLRWESLLSETIELIGPERAGRSLHETRAYLAFLRSEYPALVERWREHKRSLDLPDGQDTP